MYRDHLTLRHTTHKTEIRIAADLMTILSRERDSFSSMDKGVTDTIDS